LIFFLFFLLLKGRGVEVNVFFPLHICSGHYTHKVAGWRLFDHQKPNVMPGYFSVMPGFFYKKFVIFLGLFLLLITFVNYFLLLGGKVNCFRAFVF
jgi:hypothetical protein